VSLRARTLAARSREQDGFGLIELLIAMTVMLVGVLAIFAMFESGLRQLTRASNVTTAAALADSEMENYRAVLYTAIGMTQTALDAADPTYNGDTAYRAGGTNQPNEAVTLGSSSYSPVQTLTGADGRSYRVDTYITWASVQVSGGTFSGRAVKQVTIAVSRNGGELARVTSSFDQSTGQ
jgi:prepilin-type N-terminal cleavage/methylation domain-containing protein